jgi:O-antigen biosynthesis protein
MPSRLYSLLVRKAIKLKNKTEFSYNDWIREEEPMLWTNSTERGIKISIVVPAFNTPRRYFEPLVDSLLQQTYPNWQLCIADASADKEASKMIEKVCGQDERIIYKKLKKNYGIVGNTNEAIKLAKGDFLGFLDHDDTLSKQALNEVVGVINDHPDADLIYSDEDKLSDDGKRRLLPFFKPGWSPELLLGVNYITHFTVARKDLVNEIGGLRTGFDGAQDYDFLLRITEKTDNIYHIPKILYHWRQAHGSTAIVPGKKNYADTAGQRALSDAGKRRGLKARVLEITDRPTNYRLQFQLPSKRPLVSIIIPFKDKVDLLRQCVRSIESKSTYDNYEIILISNNSKEEETTNYLARINNPRIKLFEWNQPFNYSALNNFGRSKAKGKFLILLNNDTEVISENWLEELISVASQKEIGAVGPMLLYADGSIQHAGVILGMGGMAGHVFRRRNPFEWTDFGLPSWPRNYLAVTGACLAIEAKKFDEAGGLDEKFIMAGNDVALGITLYEKGYRNVYWPFVQLTHHENQSVGSYQNAPESDYNYSLEYYKPYLDWKDPFFNMNLDLMHEHVALRSSYDN